MNFSSAVRGEMVVMNGSGVFFLISGIGDYYTYCRKLSSVIPKYDVIWKEEM